MAEHVTTQDYYFKNLRSSAVLTNSYVAATVLEVSTDSATPGVPDPSLRNQLVLYIGLTIGSLTDARVKVEFSHDGTTYYQETFSSISSGSSTETLGEHVFTADGNYRLAIPIKDRHIKISAKGTGTVTNSLMAIAGIVGVS